MGPLERSLQGKSPNGQKLSEKQIKEIRDLDGMLTEMGNIGNDLGVGGMAGGLGANDGY